MRLRASAVLHVSTEACRLGALFSVQNSWSFVKSASLSLPLREVAWTLGTIASWSGQPVFFKCYMNFGTDKVLRNSMSLITRNYFFRYFFGV